MFIFAINLKYNKIKIILFSKLFNSNANKINKKII